MKVTYANYIQRKSISKECKAEVTTAKDNIRETRSIDVVQN